MFKEQHHSEEPMSPLSDAVDSGTECVNYTSDDETNTSSVAMSLCGGLTGNMDIQGHFQIDYEFFLLLIKMMLLSKIKHA